MIEMKMEVECGICMESYDKSSKKPRFLSCGHSFCEFCLTEMLQTKGPSLACPNCRKVTEHIYDISCLPGWEDNLESLKMLKSYNALGEQAISLQKEITGLQRVIEDYKQHLTLSTKMNNEAVGKLKQNYEHEYKKLNTTIDKLLEVIEEHKENLSKKLMTHMLKQQRQLINQDTKLKNLIGKLLKMDNELVDIMKETERYCEEQKLTNEEETQLKKLKSTFFDLISKFEELLKFKPITKIPTQSVAIDYNVIKATLDSFKLSEPIPELLREKTSINANLIPLFEKMQQIKHPIITMFVSISNRICNIISYNLITEKLSTESATFNFDFPISYSEAITHPNGTSIFLIYGGLLILYDSLNKLFLKRSTNSLYLDVKSSAITFIDNSIYVIGGIKNQRVFSSMYKYSIINEKWTQMASMSIERYEASATVINDYQICITGGANNDYSVISSIEIFNIQVNEWELCEISLKVARRCHNTVSLERDRIILLGGRKGNNEVVNTVEALDTIKHAAITLESPSISRAEAKTLIMGNCIYLFGGSSETPIYCEKFQLNENKWTAIKWAEELPKVRSPIALIYK